MSRSVDASADVERIMDAAFALGGVGYVAVENAGRVAMRLHQRIETATTEETNFYEEYLVNPTVIGLVGRRAALDCGGLRYVAIGYGDFIQVLAPLAGGGHVSVGVAKGRDVEAFGDALATIAARTP